MLHQPLRGLDGFPLVPHYKPPQMRALTVYENCDMELQRCIEKET